MMEPPISPRPNRPHRGGLLLFVLILAAWTVALCAPVDQSAAAEAIGPPGRRFYVSKLIHIVGYGSLTMLAAMIPNSLQGRRFLLLVLVLHAPLGEFLQGFFSRTPAVRDVLLDYVGIGLAMLVWRRPWSGIFRRPPTESPPRR